jgi:hypothetical protein
MKLLSQAQWDKLQQEHLQQVKRLEDQLCQANELLNQQEALIVKHEADLCSITKVFDIHEKIPNLAEVFDVLKYMTPLLREKIVDYLSYYGLSLAQENLEAKSIEDIKFMK